MPHEWDCVIIGKQLTRLIELNILDSESSSSTDSDLEKLDLRTTDDDSDSSNGDSDRDMNLFEESDSEGGDEIRDLAALMDVTKVFVQLTDVLDHFGHEGNGACLNRTMLMWGVSHGSMMNYTNRVMTALESAMGHEIIWPDRQERAVNFVHFAKLGFHGCIGLVDGTLVKFSQWPRDDGETYFDRGSNYSMNVQVICD
ncbi:hypothetical protein R1sor_000482 [Riccia sorocarpa]|uniref:Transposase n=1 Tax=Riccia sorocarpa TaxID=122646 RepID=A0ABD3GWD8_9MARC